MRNKGPLFYVLLLFAAVYVAVKLIDKYKSSESYVTRRLRQMGYTQEQIDYLRNEAGLK